MNSLSCRSHGSPSGGPDGGTRRCRSNACHCFLFPQMSAMCFHKNWDCPQTRWSHRVLSWSPQQSLAHRCCRVFSYLGCPCILVAVLPGLCGSTGGTSRCFLEPPKHRDFSRQLMTQLTCGSPAEGATEHRDWDTETSWSSFFTASTLSGEPGYPFNKALDHSEKLQV